MTLASFSYVFFFSEIHDESPANNPECFFSVYSKMSDISVSLYFLVLLLSLDYFKITFSHTVIMSIISQEFFM